jgi:hypothetical protein
VIRNFGRKTSWKGPTGRLRRRWEDNIMEDLKELDGEGERRRELSGLHPMVGFSITGIKIFKI